MKAATRVPTRTRQVQAIEQGTVLDPEVEEFTMFRVGGKPHEPIVVTLSVNGSSYQWKWTQEQQCP